MNAGAVLKAASAGAARRLVQTAVIFAVLPADHTSGSSAGNNPGGVAHECMGSSLPCSAAPARTTTALRAE